MNTLLLENVIPLPTNIRISNTLQHKIIKLKHQNLNDIFDIVICFTSRKKHLKSEMVSKRFFLSNVIRYLPWWASMQNIANIVMDRPIWHDLMCPWVLTLMCVYLIIDGYLWWGRVDLCLDGDMIGMKISIMDLKWSYQDLIFPFQCKTIRTFSH